MFVPARQGCEVPALRFPEPIVQFGTRELKKNVWMHSPSPGIPRLWLHGCCFVHGTPIP